MSWEHGTRQSGAEKAGAFYYPRGSVMSHFTLVSLCVVIIVKQHVHVNTKYMLGPLMSSQRK